MNIRIKESYSALFETAATSPNKKYIKLSRNHYSTTSHSKHRADLKDLFTNAQNYLIQTAPSQKLSADELTQLIENTRILKERYESRAGNILVRHGLYTPKKKKETLKSADDLIEKAQTLHTLHIAIQQLGKPHLDQDELRQTIKDQLFTLAKSDPSFKLQLLDKAGPGEPFEPIHDLLNEMVIDEFSGLLAVAHNHFDRFEKGLYSYKGGVWTAEAHPHPTPNTGWENLNKLAVSTLSYLPYIDYQSELFQENREKINLIFRRGLGIRNENGIYWRDEQSREKLEFGAPEILHEKGPTLTDALAPRVLKEAITITVEEHALQIKMRPIEQKLANPGQALTEEEELLLNELIDLFTSATENDRRNLHRIAPRAAFFIAICASEEKQGLNLVPNQFKNIYFNNRFENAWTSAGDYEIFPRNTWEVLRKFLETVEIHKFDNFNNPNFTISDQESILQLFLVYKSIDSTSTLFKAFFPFSFGLFEQLEQTEIAPDAPFALKVANLCKENFAYSQLITPLFKLYIVDLESEDRPFKVDELINYLELPSEFHEFCEAHLPVVCDHFRETEIKDCLILGNAVQRASALLARRNHLCINFFDPEVVTDKDLQLMERPEANEIYLRHLHKANAFLEGYEASLKTIELCMNYWKRDMETEFKKSRQVIQGFKDKTRDYAIKEAAREMRKAST